MDEQARNARNRTSSEDVKNRPVLPIIISVLLISSVIAASAEVSTATGTSSTTVENGFDPTDPLDHPVRDSDDDGYTNTGEIEAGGVPTSANSHLQSNDESSTQTVKRVGTDSELSVTPGTDIMLEITVPDYEGKSVRTEWTIRGAGSEKTKKPLGPFHSWYQGDGRDYLIHTFDSEGTYDVRVVVYGSNDEKLGTTSWTINVDDDGNEAPSVERISPKTEKVSNPSGSKKLDFTFRTRDSDTGLDRVIWWRTQCDELLKKSSTAGSQSTVTLSHDPSDGCGILAWVIDEDGAMASIGWGVPLQDQEDRKQDSDEDGLSDSKERELGTDSQNKDTDGDYYWDGDEVENGFDPTDPSDHPVRDSDGDGYTNTEEIEAGTDPTDPNSKPEQQTAEKIEFIDCTTVRVTGEFETVMISWSAYTPGIVTNLDPVGSVSGTRTISISDTLNGEEDTSVIDLVEVYGGEMDDSPDLEKENPRIDTCHAQAKPNPEEGSKDTDGDGLTDGQEEQHGTDPRDKDSDGDYYWDGDEVENGFDPLDSSDHPVRDSDGDGCTNTEEIETGTDPTDPNDYPQSGC